MFIALFLVYAIGAFNFFIAPGIALWFAYKHFIRQQSLSKNQKIIASLAALWVMYQASYGLFAVLIECGGKCGAQITNKISSQNDIMFDDRRIETSGDILSPPSCPRLCIEILASELFDHIDVRYKETKRFGAKVLTKTEEPYLFRRIKLLPGITSLEENPRIDGKIYPRLFIDKKGIRYLYPAEATPIEDSDAKYLITQTFLVPKGSFWMPGKVSSIEIEISDLSNGEVISFYKIAKYYAGFTNAGYIFGDIEVDDTIKFPDKRGLTANFKMSDFLH